MKKFKFLQNNGPTKRALKEYNLMLSGRYGFTLEGKFDREHFITFRRDINNFIDTDLLTEYSEIRSYYANSFHASHGIENIITNDEHQDLIELVNDGGIEYTNILSELSRSVNELNRTIDRMDRASWIRIINDTTDEGV